MTGANAGLQFNQGTVNNFGTIAGAGANAAGFFGGGGVVGLAGGTVNNAGSISATGANSVGVKFTASGSVINAGSISGVGEGVFLQNGAVTNTSPTGTIAGGFDGVTIVDVAKVSDAGATWADHVASTLVPPTAAATSKSPTAALSREA